MPNVDIDIDDFLWSCSKYDINELIKALVEDGHLPKEVINSEGEVKEELNRKGKGEIEFSEKLDSLKNKYYSISQDDEEYLNRIFAKYL